MELSKTTRVSLVEQVVYQIEAFIESGTWPVGTRLPTEIELMQQFDVSRNTLREAIRALVHSGLLQTKQGSGTHVCSSSVLGVAIQRRLQKSNLLETLEVRHALEREAAQLAARKRNKLDMEQLRIHLDTCQTAIKARDSKAYAEADIQLHKAIIKATHNSVLIDLYGHMTDALHSFVHGLVGMNPFSDSHQRIHCKLVDAIMAQDTDDAIEAVNEYISHLKETITIDSEERL